MLQPDIAANLIHRFKTGDAALSYVRTETVVIGQAGTAEAHSVLAALNLTPLRRLQITLGSGFSTTTSGQGDDVTVYRANASVSYRLTKWLGLTASYRFTRQEQVGPPLTHNVFSIALDAIYPIRLD
jgi:hypothetical protein